jgi:uncharacterized membrane protein
VRVDCDKVLSTPQARAFYVPNAILGFGFFFGCWLWWMIGRRIGDEYLYAIYGLLAFWLFVASGFTFYFFWLLAHLEALCPFCPWNHLLTYIAFALAFLVFKSAPKPKCKLAKRPLVKLICLCVGQFFFWQLVWVMAHRAGLN